MRCTKLEVTVLLGVGIFLIGASCLVAITVQKVFPAREEQGLKAINCTIASGNMDVKAKCQDKRQDDSSYPCLRVYVVCGRDMKKNSSLQSVKPRLVLKDFHSLKQQCTYEPEECNDKTEENSKLLQSFQKGNPIGSPLQCFYNPKDPDQVVRQKASKESYNKMVLNNVVWPLGVILLAVVITVVAACFFSTRRQNGYERLEGSTTSLQQTL
ncbi:hypothetical protein ACROYT_G039538 [Oculina patagonica]